MQAEGWHGVGWKTKKKKEEESMVAGKTFCEKFDKWRIILIIKHKKSKGAWIKDANTLSKIKSGQTTAENKVKRWYGLSQEIVDEGQMSSEWRWSCLLSAGQVI